MDIRERMTLLLTNLDEQSDAMRTTTDPKNVDIVKDQKGQPLHVLDPSEIDLMKQGAFWRRDYRPKSMQYPGRKGER